MKKNEKKLIILEHIKGVLEDKTRQLADHLINEKTLENRIDNHIHFTDANIGLFEKDLKKMGGKTEPQTQEYMSKLKEDYKKDLNTYVRQKNDVSNLEYAKNAIKEHEEFLSVVNLLEEEINEKPIA